MYSIIIHYSLSLLILICNPLFPVHTYTDRGSPLFASQGGKEYEYVFQDFSALCTLNRMSYVVIYWDTFILSTYCTVYSILYLPIPDVLLFCVQHKVLHT